MAITYPLTHPTAPGFRAIRWNPRSVVAMTQSPYTGQQQVFAWPGQWFEVEVQLPAMKDTAAGVWQAFFLALNGRAGTFLMGDSVRKIPLGSISGTLTVAAGAVANTTTLPLAGGAGAFAVGDWIQAGTAANSRLHRVVKVNGSASVDVFPALRTAYAAGTAINYVNPVGLFRLVDTIPWGYDPLKICEGLTFAAIEAIP